jgi:hypothetical protein
MWRNCKSGRGKCANRVKDAEGEEQSNSYLRTECEKTFFAHERIFEAQATKERMLHLRECAETSSRIEVCTIFFETNISIFKLLPNSSQFSE